MSVDAYLRELSAALRVRGRARRRVLAECRDHLEESALVHGEEGAAARFGPAAELAAAFDAEVAVRRARVATPATLLGVTAIGASTLVLIHSADPGVSGVPVWAAVFFLAAQGSAATAGLALLTTIAGRRAPATSSYAARLRRCHLAALALALLTMLAAGAAVPGRAPAAELLAGPVVALVAVALALRTRRLTRGAAPAPAIRVPAPLLVATALLAGAAATTWDHLDHGSIASSATAGAVEMAAALAGLLVLGPALGVRRR
ncbi:HAAS signaling domain-containing protein [Nocardioides ultimimeridianus]